LRSDGRSSDSCFEFGWLVARAAVSGTGRQEPAVCWPAGDGDRRSLARPNWISRRRTARMRLWNRCPCGARGTLHEDNQNLLTAVRSGSR
jgi:hypothetical protein